MENDRTALSMVAGLLYTTG